MFGFLKKLFGSKPEAVSQDIASSEEKLTEAPQKCESPLDINESIDAHFPFPTNPPAEAKPAVKKPARKRTTTKKKQG